MKVALDTNVLISAFTARGLSADVYRLILAEHELILSEAVLAEFEDVLQRRFGVPERHVTSFVDELRLHHVQPASETGSRSLDFIRDPDDRLVVAAALEAGASVLITGDRDLLDERDRIPVIAVFTPREFWESLRASGK